MSSYRQVCPCCKKPLGPAITGRAGFKVGGRVAVKWGAEGERYGMIVGFSPFRVKVLLDKPVGLTRRISWPKHTSLRHA